MQQDSALITFVLDESGSMGSIATEARQGFNQYLEDQVGHGGTTWWTLTTFNQKVRTRFAAIPGAEVRPLAGDYSPSGMTALYDAVGSAVTKTQAYLETLGGERPSDVIVVILTDGMENASQQWTDRQVIDLITGAEDSGWQFVFLGANQNSWEVSRRMGIRKGTVVDWEPNAESHSAAMGEAMVSSRDYRTYKAQQFKYRDRRQR
ncbi:MAG: VWA domain-containing protein [Actinomycetota bacterium]